MENLLNKQKSTTVIGLATDKRGNDRGWSKGRPLAPSFSECLAENKSLSGDCLPAVSPGTKGMSESPKRRL